MSDHIIDINVEDVHISYHPPDLLAYDETYNMLKDVTVP